ncbi:MAG: hypothetical protein ACM31C_32165, partial [Acidobacteriota bacterium]
MVTRRLDPAGQAEPGPRHLGLRVPLALAAVALVWTCALWLHATRPRPAIAVGGAFDLIVTASVAVYFISRSRRAALATAAAGATVAKLVLLPDAAHVGLAIAGGLELAVFAVLAVRARRARRAWRTARAAGAAV